jgi:hypothetical protein
VGDFFLVMNGYDLSREFFAYKFENSNKIKANHTELYFYIIDLWNRLGQKKEFGLPTSVTMECLGIGSYNTYKKTLNDLIEIGFIKLISDSKNQHYSKVVAISKFDKALDKALDKATIKAVDKAPDKAVDSIDKQINNITNKQINNKIEVFNDCEIIEFSFDDFWNLYPNKTGKKKAEEKFNSLTKQQKQKIEQHLPFFINYKPFENYNHPHATTYLNQKRYEDDINEIQNLINNQNFNKNGKSNVTNSDQFKNLAQTIRNTGDRI